MELKFKNYFLILLIQFFANFLNAAPEKVGIAVIGYNRPDYLQQVVNSLEANPESQTLPFIFFLDGGPKATILENKQIINKSKIANKRIIERPNNFGIAKNIIDARRFMFDNLKFDKAFIFEDDCVVSPDYIRFVLNLSSWALQNYSNVGIVKGWAACQMEANQKLTHLNEVKESSSHLWAYCLDRKTWNNIKYTLYEYESKFLSKATTNKDPEIRKWLKEKINNHKHFVKQAYGKKILPEKINFKQAFLSNNFPLGQDGITYVAHYLAGYISLEPVVNRALYIGKKGVHFTEAKWNNFGFAKVTLENYKSDRNLNKFKVI